MKKLLILIFIFFTSLQLEAQTISSDTLIGRMDTISSNQFTNSVVKSNNKIVGRNDKRLLNYIRNIWHLFVPTSRTITINGVSQDLTINRSWSITGEGNPILSNVTVQDTTRWGKNDTLTYIINTDSLSNDTIVANQIYKGVVLDDSCMVTVGRAISIAQTYGGGGTSGTNVKLGTNALNANSTGNNNVGIGTNALIYLNGADDNVAIGRSTIGGWAAYGASNVGIGLGALGVAVSGNRNTAVGTYALYNNASGSDNVGIGNHAGFYSTKSHYLFFGTWDRETEEKDTTLTAIAIREGTTTATTAIYLNGVTYVPENIVQNQKSCTLTDNTPTQAEVANASCLGSAATAGAGARRSIRDSSDGKIYTCESNGTSWGVLNVPIP